MGTKWVQLYNNQKGFGLVGVLISAGLVLVVATLIAQMTVQNVETSARFEDSAVANNEAQRLLLNFKAKDNLVDSMVWQPVEGEASPVINDPMKMHMNMLGKINEPGRFALAQDSDGSGGLTEAETNAWALADNAANMALIRYRGNYGQRGIDYCQGNNGLGVEVTNDPMFPVSQLPDGQDPKIYLKIERLDPSGKTDCQFADNPSLKMIPVGGGRAPASNVVDSPGQGFKLTATMMYNDNNGNQKSITSNTVVKPDGDDRAPEFVDIPAEITNSLPADWVPAHEGTPIAARTLIKPNGSTLINRPSDGTAPVFCGDAGNRTFEVLFAVDEKSVAFGCQLNFSPDTSVNPIPALNPNGFVPCETGAVGGVAFSIKQTFPNTGGSSISVGMDFTGAPEGWYRLDVRAYDSAQNSSQAATTGEFNVTFGVDLTRPVVTSIDRHSDNLIHQSLAPNAVANRVSSATLPFSPGNLANFRSRLDAISGTSNYQCGPALPSHHGWRANISSSTRVSPERITWGWWGANSTPTARWVNGSVTTLDMPRVPFAPSNATTPDPHIDALGLPVGYGGMGVVSASATDECSGSNPPSTSPYQASSLWMKDGTSPIKPALTKATHSSINISPLATASVPNIPVAEVSQNSVAKVFESPANPLLLDLSTGNNCLPNNVVVAGLNACGRTTASDPITYERPAQRGESCNAVNCDEGLICARSGPRAGTCISAPQPPCFSDKGCGNGDCHGCATNAYNLGSCYGFNRLTANMNDTVLGNNQCTLLGRDFEPSLTDAPIVKTPDSGCQDCVPRRGTCIAASDCCSNGALPISCSVLGSGARQCCNQNLGACTDNSDCCSGRCSSSGVCYSCSQRGETCSTDADCCGRNTCNSLGVCGPPTPPLTTCRGDSDCRSGEKCCPKTNSCQPAGSCLGPPVCDRNSASFAPCSDPTLPCYVPEGCNSCQPSGNACGPGNACCNGLSCINGTCGNDTFVANCTGTWTPNSGGGSPIIHRFTSSPGTTTAFVDGECIDEMARYQATVCSNPITNGYAGEYEVEICGSSGCTTRPSVPFGPVCRDTSAYPEYGYGELYINGTRTVSHSAGPWTRNGPGEDDFGAELNSQFNTQINFVCTAHGSGHTFNTNDVRLITFSDGTVSNHGTGNSTYTCP